MDGEVVDLGSLRDVPAEAGNKGFSASIPLGGTVELFGDKFFAGVVTGITFNVGRPAQYRVEWRDGRGICERWMSLEEIKAYAKLED